MRRPKTIEFGQSALASDYEFGLKTCMVINQKRYGRLRQLPKVERGNFPDLPESEEDSDKVKMQVKSMGIGIEEIFEFTDTSSADLLAHINRQKARFWRLGKFENKHTFLLVYVNCYGLEDGPKGKEAEHKQQYIVLNQLKETEVLFPIEAKLRQLIEYTENKCFVLAIYDTLHSDPDSLKRLKKRG